MNSKEIYLKQLILSRERLQTEMSRILISTAIRNSTPDQSSGHLFVYDTKKNVILKRSEIVEPPYREVDPNPRGGIRGLKGLSHFDDHIAISNASTIFLYDRFWNPLKIIHHPSCAGIHEIKLQNNSVWVTSSRNDLLLCIDFNGNIIHYYDVRTFPIINKLSSKPITPFLNKRHIIHGKIDFRDPRTHDHTVTDALHVNSFEFLNNGDLLISCGLFRVVENYKLHQLNHWLKQTIFHATLSNAYALYQKLAKKNKPINFEARAISKEDTLSSLIKVSKEGNASPILTLPGCTAPSHSVNILKDQTAIYLNTTTGEIIHLDPENGHIFSSTLVSTTFLRGVKQLPNGNIVLGDNNMLINFDMTKKKVVSKKILSDNPSEGIFDICDLPTNFSLPPDNFIDHHRNKLPINQR